ncbi:MAG: hypothetical protein ACAH83_10330 [Alphaproteobacteria bacterium]
MKKTVSAALVTLCMTLCAAQQAHAIAITCGTGGNYGTVSSQATITGPNSMVMDTTGAITYPGALSGPASGTPITCNVTGAGNGNISLFCEATKTITASGGCCGSTDRNMTGFTVKASGGTPLAQVACAGLANAAGTFKADGAGNSTINLGATMDATNVKVAGATYRLSNNAGGNITVQVKQGGTTVTSTADFSVVFSSLVGFSSASNLNFGKVSFSTQPGSSDHVDLGTDGSAVYAGIFGAQGGTLSPGQVTMNNIQNGVTVEVRCDAATTMTNGSGKSIQVTGLKVAAEGSTGSYSGAGVACAGANAGSPATTMVFNTGTRDQFFIGGKLDGGTASASFLNGNYSTANAGGVYAVVNVLTQ